MNPVIVNELNCQEALALVAEYLDKELGPAERKQLEHHMETCRHCFDRLEFERLLKARLAELRRTEPAEVLRERIEDFLERY